MLVVGLTGGIATGKSTVSKILKEHNVPLIDADLLARQVVQPNTAGLNAIVRLFGRDILLADGTLDRKKLGSIIFNDEKKRKQLNAIVHPAVRKAMVLAVLHYWIRGEKYCILDVPLLIESGIFRWVASVAVVFCSTELQLQRLTNRDSSSREDALSRIRSQMPINEKVHYADYVIENSGPVLELQSQVEAFVRKLEKQAGWSWRLSWLIPPLALFNAFLTLLWRNVRDSRRKRK